MDTNGITTAGDDKIPDQQGNSSKRIAKNTLFLYIRTFVMMIVSLYTSRVALQVLGEEDFGIYNLVAGFVVLFSFLNFAMERATLRFLLVEKGGGTVASMSRIFGISVFSHIAIGGVILIVAETVGLWFVNTRLNIPADKMVATNWVYQLAVMTTILNIVRVPYNSSIIAYEKMSFYAYFSIMEAVLRLAGVLALKYFITSDLLISYASIWTVAAVIVFLSYKLYCTRKFATCKFRFTWDRQIFFSMLAFSGWSMIGGAGNIAAQQGTAIICNIFFGAVINASIGITYQVGQAVNNIISSFQTAFNPRLVKLYVCGEIEKFNKMLISSSKISYYLTLLMILPLILNMDYILRLWLGADIPPYTTQFCRLFLIFYAIDAMSAPLWMANQATGKIKTYNIVFASMLLLNLPLCYIAFKLGASPEATFVIRIGVNVALHLFRIFYMNRQVGLPIVRYMIQTLLIPLIVTAVIIPLPYIIAQNSSGLAKLLCSSSVAIIITAAAVTAIGLNKEERSILKGIVAKKRS